MAKRFPGRRWLVSCPAAQWRIYSVRCRLTMDEATRLAHAYLAREVALGLEFVPRSVRPPPAPPARKERPAAVRQATDRPAVQALSDLLIEPEIGAASSLTELRGVLGDCSRCKLHGGRTNIVFGVGDENAELMFVGEGPGEDEDRQGEPFVGRAGRLLTDIITKGMGLDRADVYIANVVKCRPPGNRNPEPDEIVACEPFLARQIAIIRPKVLVTLGTFATQALLRNRVPISRQRGNWHDYNGVPVMPTFHPAYLLRNASGKRLVWEDIQQVMERLGLPVAKKG